LTPYTSGTGVKYGDKYYYATYSSLGVEPIIDIPLWTSSVTFAAGQTVKYGDLYYVSLTNGNLNNNPASSPLSWSGFDQPVWTTDWPTQSVLSDKIASIIVDKVAVDDQENKFLGPYVWDDTVKYTLTDTYGYSREAIVGGEGKKTLLVKGNFPNELGILMFDLNKENQEGPVRYFSSQVANAPTTSNISSISQNGTSITVTTASPHGAVAGSTVIIGATLNFNGTWTVDTAPTSNIYTFTKTPAAILFEASGTSSTQVGVSESTIILDPSYRFKKSHDANADVNLISDNEAYIPDVDGSDYSSYITGTADGRVYCEQILREITALGIALEIIIVYPSDTGLGNQGGSADELDPPTSDKVYVWGLV